MKDSFTVHDLPLDERPRERMIREGAKEISAQELIAILLGRGVKGQSVRSIPTPGVGKIDDHTKRGLKFFESPL